MCKKLTFFGLLMTLIAIGGFVVGFLGSLYGFVNLWWSFPDHWQPLKGMNGDPDSLLAYRTTNTEYLLRDQQGNLYACSMEECEAADLDESFTAMPCSRATTPYSLELVPLLVPDIDIALGCEYGVRSPWRTIYIAQDSSGDSHIMRTRVYLSTDALIAAVSVIGGLFGLGVGLVINFIIASLLRRAYPRWKQHPPHKMPAAPTQARERD